MKKLMKKAAFGITFAFASLALFSFSSAETANAGDAQGLVKAGGGTTITCPSGDWYKCYEFPNGGGIVYKGYEGDTTIQF